MGLVVLEENVPLSLSYLWKAQEEFYEKSGIKAWEVVPEYMTSNCFVAKQYTLLIINFLQDLSQKGCLDFTKPVYILEIGSGSGKFGFLLARKIFIEYNQLLPKGENGEEPKITLILSDFNDAVIDYWKQSQYFLSFKGKVEIAKINATTWREKDGIELIFSGRTLHTSDLTNPVICIANYLFDSLKQDAFCISPKFQIEHWLITLKKEIEEEYDNSISSSTIIEKFLTNSKLLTWSKNAIDFSNAKNKFYITETELNDLLEEYAQIMENENISATVLIPVGSLRLLSRLIHFSNERFLLIAGDKADIHYREFFDGDTPPDITSHDGCFSFTANFDAIGRFISRKNGLSFHATQDCDFKVSVFPIFRCDSSSSPSLIDNNDDKNKNIQKTNDVYLKENDFVFLRNAYRTYIDDFGPAHYFSLYDTSYATSKLYATQIQRHKGDKLEKNINFVFANLRLSGHDPDLFFNYHSLLKKYLDDFKEKEKVEKELYRVWANYYFIPSSYDIPFALAEIFMSVGKAEVASNFFKVSLSMRESIDSAEQKFNVRLNIGICLQECGNFHEAKQFYELCAAFRPSDPNVMKRLSDVEKRLSRQSTTRSSASTLVSPPSSSYVPPRRVCRVDESVNTPSPSRYDRSHRYSKRFESDDEEEENDDDDDDDDDEEGDEDSENEGNESEDGDSEDDNDGDGDQSE